MSIRLEKDWVAATDAVQRLAGNLGVYQLANTQGQILFIGYAGGNSAFGLKGVVRQALEDQADAAWVRWEVNTAYMSRYKELLMIHVHDHGELPPRNAPMALGKLRPAG